MNSELSDVQIVFVKNVAPKASLPKSKRKRKAGAQPRLYAYKKPSSPMASTTNAHANEK